MISKSLLLVIFILHAACGYAEDVLSTSNRIYRIPCGWPPCDNCPSSEQLVAPGIGFALEMGYGYLYFLAITPFFLHVSDIGRTAAVRWHNGTLQPVAQLQGSESYLQLMKQLSSTTPKTRFPDDIPTAVEKIQYILNHISRFINKMLHRPANRKTRILAEMVANLKESVESAIMPFRPITHAVVTSPDGMDLTEWELNDVLDYLHIKNLMGAPDDLY